MRSGLGQLPCSRPEVLAIAQLFPSSTVLLGRQAVKSRLLELSKRGELGQYAYLHFSAHGTLGDEAGPVRQPALVLARRPHHPEADAFLTMDDVSHLKLNAEVAVLSACETGLGEQVHGEGVIGLPRAFLYAGARSVVVSLWEVNDQSTATLMQEFYTQMRRGRSRADALRAARQTLLRSSTSAHPYYWAPFILVGDAGSGPTWQTE